MEAQILGLVIFLACACAVVAVPTNNREEDLSHLVSLLGKLKDIERVRQTSQQTGSLDGGSASRVSVFPDITDSEATDSFEDEESLRKGYLGRPTGPVNKRQGAWSYDYGLGGGRFGKRNYGDYGIGGGRFGRDVDHVDLADASETDLTS